MSDWWFLVGVVGVFFFGWEFLRGVQTGKTTINGGGIEYDRRQWPVLFHVVLVCNGLLTLFCVAFAYVVLTE